MRCEYARMSDGEQSVAVETGEEVGSEAGKK